MLFEIFFRKYIFGNPLSVGTYTDGEEAWSKYDWMAKHLRDGYGVYLVAYEHDNVHVLAETNKW